VDSPTSTAAQRRAKRKQIMDRELARGRQRGLDLSRSTKCAGFGGLAPPQHAGDHDGCKNTGRECLCECHDPAEEATRG